MKKTSNPKNTRKLYVYAVIKGKGIKKGINGVSFAGRVLEIPYKEMAIIASPLKKEMAKSSDIKSKLSGNIGWAKKNILAHYKLTHDIARDFPLIPFKFGMIMSSQQSLENKLGANYPKLEKIFKKIENREEWAIKLSADFGRLEKELENEIALEKEQALSGFDWLIGKKNELKIKHAVEKSVGENISRFEKLLKNECDAITNNTPYSPQSAGEKTIVSNWACLLKKKGVENLRRKMVNVPKNRGFQVIMTGPWPPYNFVSKKL